MQGPESEIIIWKGAKMKILSRLSFLAFFALALSGLPVAAGEAPAAQQAAARGPSIELSEMSWDFGDLYDGKEYVHHFKVKNVGTATLEIKKVLPG